MFQTMVLAVWGASGLPVRCAISTSTTVPGDTELGPKPVASTRLATRAISRQTIRGATGARQEAT